MLQYIYYHNQSSKKINAGLLGGGPERYQIVLVADRGLPFTKLFDNHLLPCQQYAKFLYL